MATKELIMSVFVLTMLTVFGEALTSASAENATKSTGSCATPSPDLDNDGTVGFSDYLIFARVFNSREGDGTYAARYDLNSDGSIDFPDFLIFAESFGRESWSGVISPDRVALPPPTWIFAGDVPAADRNALREEMEYVRAYFADRYGVEATGFTVLVGTDYEALASRYHEIVGEGTEGVYDPEWRHPHGWVTTSRTGSAVTTLVYGTLTRESFSSVVHFIAHEYFHVLQGQLASGFAELDNGEKAWNITGTPKWMVEGFASYADFQYTPFRTGRRPFLSRYSPYSDIAWYRLQAELDTTPGTELGEGDLARIEGGRSFCNFGDFYSYGLSFAASTFLVSQANVDAFVRYWKLFGERQTLQTAFEEAACIGVDEFYKAFDAWLPSQLPPPQVQLSIQLLWPDMEPIDGYPYLLVENWGIWDSPRPPNMSTGFVGRTRLPLYLTFTYNADAVGRGYLAFWWSNDQCTEYLIGWYKDGELTPKREDATPVAFTGISSRIEWTLPAHPDRLPRLKERMRPTCQ